MQEDVCLSTNLVAGGGCKASQGQGRACLAACVPHKVEGILQGHVALHVSPHRVSHREVGQQGRAIQRRHTHKPVRGGRIGVDHHLVQTAEGVMMQAKRHKHLYCKGGIAP
jgi:hypothetical protein